MSDKLKHSGVRFATTMMGALLLAACSAGTPSYQVSVVTEAPLSNTASPAPSVSDSQALTGSSNLTGIVIAICAENENEGRETNGAMTLRPINPDGTAGQVTGVDRVFRPASDLSSAWSPCYMGPARGRVLKEEFNADLTAMAVTHSPQADGTTHMGYIDIGNKFHDMSSSTNDDYSGVTKQVASVFNPVTGRLWFQTVGSEKTPRVYGSVDPTVGSSSSRVEPVALDPYAFGQVSIADRFYFEEDGNRPRTMGLGDVVTSTTSDSQIEVVATRGDGGQPPGFRVGAVGQLDPKDQSAPTIELKDDQKACFPTVIVGEDTFLCSPHNTGTYGMIHSGPELYKMTMNQARTELTQVNLLPDSDREVGDMVLSPDHGQVAFLAAINGSAVSNGVEALYVVPVSGGTPRKVADIDPGTLILGWE